MADITKIPWPINSYQPPETGIECKDYVGTAKTLAAESRRLFTKDVVEMEACWLTDLGKLLTL